MPARLVDVVNVKDWGAKGDNIANDRAAIQAAIDAALAAGGGIVFFPPGAYTIGTGGLTCGSENPNISVNFFGGGKDSSGVYGANHSGYLISKGSATYDAISRIDSIAVENGSTTVGTGGIRITRQGACVLDSNIAGFIGIDAVDAIGASIASVSGVGIIGNLVTPPPMCTAGTIGIAIGSGMIYGCRLMGAWDIAFALSGYGSAISASSTESCNIGVRVGWSPRSLSNPTVAGEYPAYGAVVEGLQTEQLQIAVELYRAHGCVVHGNAFTGTVGIAHGNVTAMSWSGGQAHVTTQDNPNGIPDGSWLLVNVNWLPIGHPWRQTMMQQVTVTGPNTFHFAMNDPGTPWPGNTSWFYAQGPSIRCRIATECAIIANQAGHNAPYPIDLDYDGQAQHRNNVYVCDDVNRGWLMPTDTSNIAAWHFDRCGSPIRHPSDPGIAPSNPNAKMHVADLPGNFTPVNEFFPPGPFEGQEYDVIDGSAFGFAPPHDAGFADRVIGGGNGRYKVRYDGQHWRRIG
ncbi:MAG: hypothetical protein C5B54_11020 [Acidobacteria bacterium]|nr:MAG: hypothetical protein C5B54_11020 [Acidobacteriota bacterium]